MPTIGGRLVLTAGGQAGDFIAENQFIAGALRVIESRDLIMDEDGNQTVAVNGSAGFNDSLFLNNQIVYIQDEAKLYQLTIVQGNGLPPQHPSYTATTKIWSEFTGFGSSNPNGTTDPLSIGSLTVNDGGTGTKLDLQDNNTLNITAQSANTILNIESSSLGLNVDSRGLLQLDTFDYTPTPNDGNLLFSGSAYYVGAPDPLNLLAQTLSPIGASSFNYTSQNDTYDIVLPSSTTTKIYSNYNVSDCYAGQIFLITFTITGTPGDTAIYLTNNDLILSTQELSEYQYVSGPVEVGNNSIKLSPNFTGTMKIVFGASGEASYTISNLKLIKLSI